MRNKKLFGARIEPACGYCGIGRETEDGAKILCPKVGVMTPSDSCRKFRYDPLKRVPAAVRPLPCYRTEDFEL